MQEEVDLRILKTRNITQTFPFFYFCHLQLHHSCIYLKPPHLISQMNYLLHLSSFFLTYTCCKISHLPQALQQHIHTNQTHHKSTIFISSINDLDLITLLFQYFRITASILWWLEVSITTSNLNPSTLKLSQKQQNKSYLIQVGFFPWKS